MDSLNLYYICLLIEENKTTIYAVIILMFIINRLLVYKKLNEKPSKKINKCIRKPIKRQKKYKNKFPKTGDKTLGYIDAVWEEIKNEP